MHPTGIEPALKASEASVLSIRLRMQIITKLLHHPDYDITKKELCLPEIFRNTRKYSKKNFDRKNNSRQFAKYVLPDCNNRGNQKAFLPALPEWHLPP